MSFERKVIGDIPLHEAAAFFTSMKQPVVYEDAVKTASSRMKSAAQQIIEKMLAGEMPEGKAGKFKTAAKKEKVGPVGAASIGGAIGAGASALHGKKLKEIKASRLKAALGGSAARVAVGTAAAAAAGYGIKKLHEHSEKRAAQRPPGLTDRQWISEFYTNRMKYAAVKLGYGEGSPAAGTSDPDPNSQGGQPTPAASNVPSGPMGPPSGPAQDPAAAKPSTEPTVPINYMGAELVARAAQNTNEVGFLRDRLNATTEQNNLMAQQVQSFQDELSQIQQTQQAAGDQVMQATNEAVAASNRALQQSMQAANMRIGIQKMRESMMELASQDPESMGTLAQQDAMQQQNAEQAAVNQQTGKPEQTATQGTQPGSPAAEAPEEGGSEEGGASSQPKDKAPQVQIKTGAIMTPEQLEVLKGSLPYALPGAAVGSALAGYHGYKQSHGGQERAQEQVRNLEAEQTGGFSKSLELAKAKKNLADAEVHTKHPDKMMARNLGLGALMGSAAGSGVQAIVDKAREFRMLEHAKNFRGI